MFYILAKVANSAMGTESVICEFQNAQKMRRFAADIMSGNKALPVWRKVSDVHPHSGEQMLIRSREFINGTSVLSMIAVQPKAGMEDSHEYAPANFEAAGEYKKSQYGFWTCPADDAPEGAVIGAKYPVKRDENQRRYVTLRIAEDVTPERRHYLDAERAGGYRDEFDEEDADVEYGEDDDDDRW